MKSQKWQRNHNFVTIRSENSKVLPLLFSLSMMLPRHIGSLLTFPFISLPRPLNSDSRIGRISKPLSIGLPHSGQKPAVSGS